PARSSRQAGGVRAGRERHHRPGDGAGAHARAGPGGRAAADSRPGEAHRRTRALFLLALWNPDRRRTGRRHRGRRRPRMEGRSTAVPFEVAQQPLHRLDAARESDEDIRGRQARARGGQVTAGKKATLALACGEVFEGTSVGAQGETIGEVVFNTSHTGYQEILTDPSYAGQLVTFTVSEVGNYGIHFGDEQAETAQAAGLIARRVCKEPSNWRSQQSLPQFLERNAMVGIEGVDTRRLVRILRTTGAQQG